MFKNFVLKTSDLKKKQCDNRSIIKARKYRKNSWNYRLKANQITALGWDYQFMMIRIGFDYLIQQGSYHYNNKLLHTCIYKIAQLLPHIAANRLVSMAKYLEDKKHEEQIGSMVELH